MGLQETVSLENSSQPKYEILTLLVPDNDLSTFMNDPFEDLLPESAPMDEPDCRQRGANPELPECEEQGEFL